MKTNKNLTDFQLKSWFIFIFIFLVFKDSLKVDFQLKSNAMYHILVYIARIWCNAFGLNWKSKSFVLMENLIFLQDLQEESDAVYWIRDI